MDVSDRIERVQSELDTAAETATRDVQLKLNSVDEGLEEVVGGDKTEEAPTHADRLAELLDTLDGIEAKAEGETTAHVTEARDLLAEYVEERRAE